MLSSFHKSAALAVALLFVAPATSWSAVSFSGEFLLSGSAFSDPGLVINADPSSGPINLNLEVGETAFISLFDIWTNESDVGHDDTVPQSVEVTFDFTDPETFGILDGSSSGVSFFGIIEYGRIVWDNPLVLTFGDNDEGMLSISLSDAIFNAGWFGLAEGEQYGASIGASFTLVSGATPVPLPAPLFLLAAGLTGLIVVARRRREQVR